MLDQIKAVAARVFEGVVAARRTIHQNPELALEEHDTAAFIANALREIGVDHVQTGVYHTGVVGTLRGGLPGPTLLLRADIDALPIQEARDFPFASQNEGKMHACGHDAHTASLLGTARILKAIQDDVHGTVRFCFQPSEEKIPGGAKFMIDEGVLDASDESDAVSAAFGQHVQPQLPAGTIGVRPGMFMASADEIHVTVHGEGGHAAAPHDLSADATYVAAQIVTALQSIVSRHAPPDVPSVLTIGKLIADGATNVIPESARLEGTFRTMDEDWRFDAHDKIRRVISHTAQAHGATADVEVLTGYPALYNHETETSLVREAAVEYAGEENVADLDRWFAGEDFAYFLQETPGAFYTLGVRNEEKGYTHGLHTPQFAIDEDALRTGPGFMAYLAWKRGRHATNGE